MYYQQLKLTRQSPLHGVVRPGAPVWLVRPGFLAGALVTLATVICVLLGVAYGMAMVDEPLKATLGATSLMALPFPPAAYVVWRYRDDRLVDWQGNVVYEGVRIEGEGLTILEDINHRFDYARRLVGQVPTGIEWASVKHDVAEVIWDAAGHAARVSALDVELRDMAYAEPGTPQGALKRTLEERRAEHWQILRDEQREADDLARQAGNAAAAAKVALARTGSIHALEIAAPSPKAAMARRSLAEVRARLALLADVWAELDESTVLLSERLGLDGSDQGPQQDPSAS